MDSDDTFGKWCNSLNIKGLFFKLYWSYWQLEFRRWQTCCWLAHRDSCEWQVYCHLLSFSWHFKHLIHICFSSEIKTFHPFVSSSLFPLSLLAHTVLSIARSVTAGPPGKWQGRIRRWEVDRQGWQNKNHALYFNGWPDGNIFLSTPRSSTPHPPFQPCPTPRYREPP